MGNDHAWNELRPAEPREVGVRADGLRAAVAAIEAEIAAGAIPGAVALVARRGRIVLFEAVGDRSASPRRTPMRTDTVFDLASLTKVVATWASIMHLIARGACRPGDRVREYAPELRGDGRDGRWKDAVTIGHLLSHTAGFPARTGAWRFCGSRGEIVAALFAEPLEYEPGTRAVYASRDFLLLGELVERLSGVPLDRYARREIFEPLEMADTCFLPSPQLVARCAPTEFRPQLGRHLLGEVHDESAAALGGVAGHAGLFGTALDLLRFGAMVLRQGEPLLPRDLVALSLRDHAPRFAEGWGYGWMVYRDGSVGHTGYTGTSLTLHPALDAVAVLLTNRVHISRDIPVMERLRAAFHAAVWSAMDDDAGRF